VLGDAEIGAYEVVKRCRPNVIALGYDQTALKEDLENHLREFGWKLKIVTLGAYKPDTHHSSLLNKKRGRR